ncbi:MAG: hypothetical protein WCO79_00160 [bacterium]
MRSRNILTYAVASFYICLVSLWGIGGFSAPTAAAQATNSGATTANTSATSSATSSPQQDELDALLKRLTATSSIPDYLKNAKPPTEADAPPIPEEFKKAPLNVTLDPEYPSAFQDVVASVDSYSADMDRSVITWTINGKVVQRGTGTKTFRFKAGKNGSYTSLNVSIFFNGVISTETVSITPATVDLLWQADSYVPPFYKGKALFSHQSGIKVVAVPNIFTKDGTLIPVSKLIYRWKLDKEFVAAVSGVGKSMVTFSDKIPVNEKQISVEVSTTDSSVKTVGQIFLHSVGTSPVLYQDTPLTGISYEHALPESLDLTDSEMKLVIEPYFFSVKSRDSNSLYYSWSLNGKSVPDVTRSNIVFKVPDAEKGSAQVNVELRQPTKVFQTSASSLFINYTSQGSSDSKSLF